jgi:hypothetical protein
VWGQSQQQVFEDLRQHLCSALVLSLSYLQQPFGFKTDDLYYDVGVIVTQHDHHVAYHCETLLDVFRKYHTYDKEMYSIVQACFQWRHYILGKQILIHTDHKPLQFMNTKGKLHNYFHQKWSTYYVVDCLNKPPVATLTMVLDSCNHETSG